jgi:alkylation response protein AidB-like acyl-CoA dehydrogenase
MPAAAKLSLAGNWLSASAERVLAFERSHSHLTRLDFAVGSADLMLQVLTLALNYATTRNGLGSALAERPMMANVLAGMAVEVEDATLMALRMTKAIDYRDANPWGRRNFRYIAHAILDALGVAAIVAASRMLFEASRRSGRSGLSGDPNDPLGPPSQ